MHPQLSGLILALLTAATTARTIYRFPQDDVKLTPSVPTELVRRDLDHTESFSWSAVDSSIIDIDVSPNNLEVNCTSCQLSGSVRAQFDERFDVWKSDLKISFSQTTAHVDLNILGGSGSEVTVPLWNIGGISVPGAQATYGLGFYIELAISVLGDLEATGGFEFTIPDGSWIAASLTGDVVDANFDGAESQMLAWDVVRGSTTLKVSLRLRSELGVNTKLVGIGSSAVVGVYLNLFETVITLEDDDNNETCALEATESWNINAGAYVEADVDLDNFTLDIAPTKSTTIFTGPTFTQCLEEITSTDGSTLSMSTPVYATPSETGLDSGPVVTTTPDCEEVDNKASVTEATYVTETAYVTTTPDCDEADNEANVTYVTTTVYVTPTSVCEGFITATPSLKTVVHYD
ncbi:hypothetical protein BGZ61DRAFT_538546 [Ilyonectria robusta]|uniref:uncharacterized protein n=1 Tax=Ilyonectria robusta TaxID=1079257 RepID=UPI001E8E2B24|nr:uncharacterized protein BGZ61DRAFT_538546 [Ilyonectria robusta]KAH8665581.1 hypothetical protein BGZ61DRAFT_538546 [Ilyonectria robusta]